VLRGGVSGRTCSLIGGAMNQVRRDSMLQMVGETVGVQIVSVPTAYASAWRSCCRATPSTRCWSALIARCTGPSTKDATR